MALSVQGASSQVALLDQHSLGIELMSALSISGKELMADGQKAVARFKGFKEAMETQCCALEEANRTLTQKIAALEGELREKAAVLEKQLDQALQREQAAKQEAEILRQEKNEAEKKSAESKAAALAAQAKVQQAEMRKCEARALAAERDAAVAKQETATVRAEAAQKEDTAAAEKKAAVAAATALAQAQIAAEKQKTTEALQEKAESARKIAAWEQWRKDNETMVALSEEIVHEYKSRLVLAAAGNLFEEPWSPSVRNFIKKRLYESFDLITDPAQQRSDTKELQQLALSTPASHWTDSYTRIAKEKLLEFCKARIDRGT